ncbi:MAG: hypothetical protein KDE09_15255, partial [Anaerolineales bacterium]|nr:hypothetical protein [Anaerolineales bacterium]
LTPALVSLVEVDLVMANGGQIDTTQLQTLQNGSVTADAVSVTLNALTNPTGSSFYAEAGGQISIPAITSYLGSSGSAHVEFRATDPGSRLNFASLNSVTGNTFTNSMLKIRAENGGVVDLSNVAVIPGGHTQITAAGANSLVDLTDLTLFVRSGRGDTYLEAVSNGHISAPSLTVMRGAGLYLNNTGVLEIPQLTEVSDAFIEATFTAPALTTLTNINGSELVARNGALIQLPSLTSYVGSTAAVDTRFLATGFNSTVSLPALTTLSGNTFANSELLIRAEGGGLVEIPALPSITTGNTQVEVEGSISHVDLSGLENFSRTTLGQSFVSVGSNATLSLATTTTTFTDVDLAIANNAIVNAGELYLDTDADLTAVGTLATDVVNNHVVTTGNSIALLNLAGDYTQLAGGSLRVDIRDDHPAVGFDRYTMTGNVSLAGTVRLVFTPGFTPQTGDSYNFLTIDGTLAGQFTTVIIENLDNGLSVELTYTSDAVIAEIVSVP